MSVPSEAAFSVRQPAPEIGIIEVRGELTAKSESALMNAYQSATAPDVRTVVLCFNELTYMNSSGIGLIVTLLIRAKRNRQRLLAFGLSDHYRQIFDVTRLSEAIQIFNTEAEALAAVDRAAV